MTRDAPHESAPLVASWLRENDRAPRDPRGVRIIRLARGGLHRQQVELQGALSRCRGPGGGGGEEGARGGGVRSAKTIISPRVTARRYRSARCFLSGYTGIMRGGRG